MKQIKLVFHKEVLMRSYVLTQGEVVSEMGGVKLYPKTGKCHSNDYTEKMGGKDLKWGI